MNRASLKFQIRTTLVAFFFLVTASPLCHAQNPTAEAAVPNAPISPPSRGGDLINQLSLSADQVDGIKAIRDEQRDARRLATQRVRLAQRALDEAIYGPGTDEATVEARARDLAEAEGEALRLRAVGEIRIRRILTDDQLATLRELRRRARFYDAEKRKQNRQDRSGFGPAGRGPDGRRSRPAPGQPDMSGQPAIQGAPERRPEGEQMVRPSRPQ